MLSNSDTAPYRLRLLYGPFNKGMPFLSPDDLSPGMRMAYGVLAFVVVTLTLLLFIFSLKLMMSGLQLLLDTLTARSRLFPADLVVEMQSQTEDEEPTASLVLSSLSIASPQPPSSYSSPLQPLFDTNNKSNPS